MEYVNIDVYANVHSCEKYSRAKKDLENVLSLLELNNIGEISTVGTKNKSYKNKTCKKVSHISETKLIPNRCMHRVLPSVYLTYLQRLYAHIVANPDDAPTPFVVQKIQNDKMDEKILIDKKHETLENVSEITGVEPPIDYDTGPGDDPVLHAVLESGCCISHILSHATEGFFMPDDFERPIFDTRDPSRSVPGGWLGSSFRLFNELAEIAPCIGINLSVLRGTFSL